MAPDGYGSCVPPFVPLMASMARRPRGFLAALAAILCVACGLRPGFPVASGGAGYADPPVGVLTEGSAFDRPELRQQVARSLERASRKRVLLLGVPASVGEGSLKELVSRLTKENPGLARYDWREPHCAAHVDVLTAVQRNVDAVYRVSLDYTERSRPATDAELALRSGRSPGLASVLRALHLVASRTVREEALTGTVALSAFAPGSSRHIPVSRTAEHLEPTALTPRIDIGAAVAEAIAALPPPPEPQWAGVARKLVSAGCPFLALAVYETRLRSTGAPRGVGEAALAAIARSRGKATAHRADTSRETMPSRRRATEDQDHAETPPAGEEQYTCDALCNMHIVELCNSDRVLWISHKVNWEATPCGTRRDEPFLQECYREQWLGGTFDSACIRPCESTAEGHERLMRILQDAGCLASGRHSGPG